MPHPNGGEFSIADCRFSIEAQLDMLNQKSKIENQKSTPEAFTRM